MSKASIGFASRLRRAMVLSTMALCALSVGCEDEEKPKDVPVGAKAQPLTPLPDGPEGWAGVDFVALNSVYVKQSAEIQNDIAVLDSTPGPHLASNVELTIGRNTTVTGDVWADSIFLKTGAQVVGEANYNDIGGSGTVTGEQTTTLPLPLQIELPPVPSVSPGTEAVTLAKQETRTLAPGAYGDVLLKKGTETNPTTLSLTGGTYEFASLLAKTDSAIYCQSPCEVLVSGIVSFSRDTLFGPITGTGLGPSDAKLTTVASNGGSGPNGSPSAFTVGGGSTLRSYVHVPQGTAYFKQGAMFEGRAVARDLILGMRVETTGCATIDETCDGIDDDCNGFIDDDYVPLGTTCGVGACGDVGQTSCVGGQVVDSCEPGTPLSPTDESCDSIDDDCDGQVDEEYAPEATTCGVGACQAAGETQCVNGSVVDACVPGTPGPSDETCDGIDQDCDGTADQGYIPLATSCGIGACGATGQTSCVEGAVVDQCTPGTPEPNDTTCDGEDDDCDGTVDEDFAAQSTTCGTGACAANGSTSCQGGAVVDQCTPGAPAANDTTCDGVDDDCDGQADEDFAGQSTFCGVGACAATGATTCDGGAIIDSCTPLLGDTVDTTCDGVDDDCDGQADEDYAPYSTSCGDGACSASGATSCVEGAEVDSCEPGTAAANDATCDGLDNDCDGEIDEDFVPYPSACGVGACGAAGMVTCDGGEEVDSCVPAPPAADDATCDGLDNDCDGQVDEDFANQATTCGVGACGSTGQTSCVGGEVLDSCSEGTPAGNDATCDGIDDDCDGQIDEDFAATATSCGQGVCAATGTTVCVNGAIQDTCAEGTPEPMDASCDGLDNDCDGETDEDYVSAPTSCGVGACGATGSTSCVGGVEEDSCTEGVPAASDESCDGIDDDCDGQTDEDFSGQATTCGVGACGATGVQACVNGAVEDSCSPGTPATGDLSCDGIDDDCDGLTDEDYVQIPTNCGIGACGATGSTSCVAGSVQDSCVAGTPADSDATCDGVDDDCDGTNDEDYVDVPTSCGVGVCAATGVQSCVDGSLEDSCEPFEGDLVDTTCDGVDDDCDGQADEDYAPFNTSCGVGACGAAGITSCVGGFEEDSCEPGTAAADDATCDGIDNDCDGETDEEYLSTPTSCGVGACGASGATSCVDGIEEDSCTPGTPANDDSTCDGIDDDCDGFTDEEYEAPPTSCGVGACGATGFDQCISGSVVDSCTPGTPADDDASCNDVDDDCDGVVDEDYLPEIVGCGIGACASTGTTSCGGGVITDDCEAGIPASDDSLCNGIDDDCDGGVDEEYVATPTSCGVGACAATGMSACIGGEVDAQCDPGAPAPDDASCDGVDNDCDGTNDEDYAPVDTTCGVGACFAEGATACIEGAVQDQCAPGAPAADDATCDGVDDDCDGTSDENYVSIDTTCGVGACGATGATSCVGGDVEDSCTPGAPAADDATCDGVDDDCDGVNDENYASVDTSCGVGACGAEGATSCVDGDVEDSCTPGTPAANDATCDGVDDDCDGGADEDYVVTAITCGVGSCETSGDRVCSGGAETDQCTPLDPPSATDDTCDNVDNDCDGTVDDDYQPETVTCGVGACQQSAETTCSGGEVTNDCQPLFPTFSTDETCDGIDEDCDGATDEEYVEPTIFCGVGECRASGVTACVDGAPVDQCTELPPAADDSSCDGKDNDCNGSVDEDFSPVCSGDAVQTCSGGSLVNTPCGDGDVCNGIETCSSASCQTGTALDEDDGNPCTVDSCDAVLGVSHTPTALGTDCGGGNACDGAGSCIAPPTIVTHPTDLSVVLGQPFTLAVQASGEQLTYQWDRGGTPVAGETGPLLTVVSSDATHDGAVYSVTVSNAAGSVTSDDATITAGDFDGPTIELTSPAAVTTSSDPTTVTGIAVDTGTGLSSVWVESNQFPGVPLAAVVNLDSGVFSAEVPLVPGVNQLTVFAEDAAGNQSTAQVVATFEISSVPTILVSSPAFGAVVQDDQIDIEGVVRTSLLSSQVHLELDGQTFYPTGTGGEYGFTFEGIRLNPGRNDLQIKATTPETTVTTEHQIFFGEGSGGGTGEPPRISLPGITAVVFETSADHEVSGTVEADTCVASLTVNGATIEPQGTGGFVSFQAPVTVPSDGLPFEITVRAEDCFGRWSEAIYEVLFDAQEPIVSLSVADAPAITDVSETPHRVYGTIAEPNLAGISVGSQSIGAVPTGGDTWQFEFDVPLAAGEERTLDIGVWDQAGNREERQIILHLDAALEIAWLSPTSGQEIVALDDPMNLNFSIRVPGMAPGDTAQLIVDSQGAVPMSGAGEVRSALVAVPVDGGAHQASAQVLDSGGAPKASSTIHFSLVDESTVDATVVSVFPPRGAQNVEANEPIVLNFNRPIDSADLEIEVRETGRSKVYEGAPAGADLKTNGLIDLIEISRDYEQTPGALSAVPGDQTFVFYPARRYVYTGSVKLIVRYEGHDVFASNFKVRKAPTMVDGFLIDQNYVPLAGIEVSLADQGRSTVTDSSGGFSFGYGTLDQAINPGLQRLLINPKQAHDGYGAREILFNPQEGRRTDLGAISTPQLDRSEPYRFVAGGDSSVALAGGDLLLDLSAAQVLFPDGGDAGAMHAQPFGASQFNISTGGTSYPVVTFSLNPPGVEMAGEASLSLTFPLLGGGTTDYALDLPRYVLILAVEPQSLMLTPVGVGEVNHEARTLQSHGPVLIRRMDAIGIGLPAAGGQEALKSFIDGEITLEQLRSVVRAY